MPTPAKRGRFLCKFVFHTKLCLVKSSESQMNQKGMIQSLAWPEQTDSWENIFLMNGASVAPCPLTVQWC